MRPKEFFIFFFILTFSIILLSLIFRESLKISSNSEIFSNNFTNLQRGLITKLTSEDYIFLKLNHFNYNKRIPEIGVFGNSRSIELSSADLDLNPSFFFNYSVGGQSFRNSVKMIKVLHDKKILPKTVIVSFDFFELGLPGGNGFASYSLKNRLGYILKDVIYLIKKKKMYDSFLFFYNSISDEIRNFAHLISFSRNLNFVNLFFFKKESSMEISLQGNHKIPYNEFKKKNYKFEFSRKDRYLHLEKDLELVRKIEKDSGSKVYIYVSPIVPEIKTIDFQLSRNAQDIKTRFFQNCEKNLLKCFESPYIENKTFPFWKDSSHPPSKKLGLWIQKEILNAI